MATSSLDNTYSKTYKGCQANNTCLKQVVGCQSQERCASQILIKDGQEQKFQSIDKQTDTKHCLQTTKVVNTR